jgi:hypothetical protein
MNHRKLISRHLNIQKGGLVYSSLLKVEFKIINNPIKAELIVSNTNISVIYYLIKRRKLLGYIREAPLQG